MTGSVKKLILPALALGVGIAFPLVSTLWKVLFLIFYLIFKVIDIERERKLMGATSFFFIGMILSYLYRSIQIDLTVSDKIVT